MQSEPRQHIPVRVRVTASLELALLVVEEVHALIRAILGARRHGEPIASCETRLTWEVTTKLWGTRGASVTPVAWLVALTVALRIALPVALPIALPVEALARELDLSTIRLLAAPRAAVRAALLAVRVVDGLDQVKPVALASLTTCFYMYA